MDNVDLKVVSSFFRSQSVTLLVGHDRIRYFVHAAALKSSESPSLQTLISEIWNAKNETIDWSHWDAGTVERALTWLYTRTYQLPLPGILTDATEAQSTVSTISDRDIVTDAQVNWQPDNGSNSSGPAVKLMDEVTTTVLDSGVVVRTQGSDISTERQQTGARQLRSESAASLDSGTVLISPTGTPTNSNLAAGMNQSKGSLQHEASESFGSTREPVIEPQISSLGNPDRQWTATLRFDRDSFPFSTHTYRAPLLALVRLHHFAVYHLCEPLQKCTLQRLRDVLHGIDCSQPRAISELEEVIHYVYENVAAVPSSKYAIRQLLCCYAADNYAHLAQNGFEDIVFSGDDFSVDFARELSRRFLSSTYRATRLSQQLEEAEMKSKRHKTQIDELQAQRQKCKICRSWPTYDSEFGVWNS